MRALVLATLTLALAAAAQPTAAARARLTPDTSEGQRRVRLAAGPDGFLAVWEAGLGGRSSVRAARIGLDGVTRDPAGLTLASGAGGRFEPAVAFGHGVYYVVWSSMQSGDHVLYGSRVDLQGTLLDGTGVQLSDEPTAASMADVAATTDGFVVVWAQAESTERGYVPRARRIGADGVPVDAAPVHVLDVTGWTAGEDFGHWALGEVQCEDPRVAVQGNVALLVWAGTAKREGGGYTIERAALDLTTGTVSLSAAPAITGAQSRLFRPAVAAFAGGFAVSWTDYRGRGDLGLPADNAALLTTTGAATLVALAPTHVARKVFAPALATNGAVAFVEPVQNPGAGNRTEHHLVLRQVLADGSSPGADVQVEQNAAWPALAVHSTGVTALAYTVVNGAPADTGHLFVRLVTVP